MYIQVTIDGPSGVGKSTLAKALAKSLNYLFVNTGLIFRGLAWYLLKEKIEDKDIEKALEKLDEDKEFIFGENVWYWKKEVIPEKELITQEIANKSSKIATLAPIRDYVLKIERAIAKTHNIVMEGRDIGTAVFPNALLKLYLTANPEIRSKRRYNELKKKGILGDKKLEEIRDEIMARDKQDMERELAPLVKPIDAIELFSDNKSVEELVEEVKELLTKKLN